MRSKVVKMFEVNSRYKAIIAVFVLSLVLFLVVIRFNSLFTEIMSVATFLAWHNLFEYISILAAFSIFIVTYYTYDESGNVQMLVLGCAFLIMGALDAFHTLSYKGMADFFVPNTSANRATTFWVLSRLIGSTGVLSALILPVNIKTGIRKQYFILPTLLVAIVLLMVETYYPGVFPLMFSDEQGLTAEKVFLEYTIIIIMGITFLKVFFKFKKTSSKQDSLLLIGILLSIFSEFAFISYGSVYDAYNYLGHIYKIIAYFVLFRAIYIENVKMPYREMIKAKNQLSEYSEGLHTLVKQRTKELEEINRQLLLDLEYAKEIQRSLLPSKMPNDISVSFDEIYIPAEHLSGDFYNVVKLDEQNIAIYIGDVAGHGVSAAMLTVFANQNIRPIKEAEETEYTLKIISPGFVLKSLYKAFNKTNFNNETYIVMLYGIYNLDTRCFTYASGGLNVSPLVIKNTGEVAEIDVTGFAICKLGDIIMPFYEDRVIQLEPGDKILFFTDGLVEAENVNEFKYKQEHLIDVIKTNHSVGGTGLCDAIKKDFFQFTGSDVKHKDDITLLVMEVN